MSIDAGRWGVRSMRMKFALGELTLFNARFSLAVLNTYFTELAENEFCTWSGWGGLPESVDGAFVLSQPVSGRLARFASYPDAIRYVPKHYLRYFLLFEGTFSDYVKKFSSKSRSNRKREIRKFAELSGGIIDWREYRKPEELDEFFPHALELSSKTFQERLLDAGLPDSEEYRQRILELARKDKVRAYLLFLAGKPVSYLLTEIREPGILTYLYLGYDPELQSWSPGMVLQFKAIERLFDQSGLRMLDFTEGEGSHKKYFATGSTQCADIYYFRRSLRIYLLLLLHRMLDSISRGIVNALDSLGWKSRVKKFFRSRA